MVTVDVEPDELAMLAARIPAQFSRQIQPICAAFANAAIPPAHLIRTDFSPPSVLLANFPPSSHA